MCSHGATRGRSMEPDSICVINYSAPELNHLAAQLSREGRLGAYVRPYAGKRRRWERALQRIPAVRGLYRGTFGRRSLPGGLRLEQVRETAVLADWARAGLLRLPGCIGCAAARGLHWHIQNAVAEAGAREARGASAVVASYVVAHAAFARAEALKVLNYPIAHHRYIRRIVAEEAELEPAFASTLPRLDAQPDWLQSRLDQECELADHILVGSRFALRSFIEAGIAPGRVAVIPYGVDISLFRPSGDRQAAARVRERGTTLSAVFVGQIAQRKGISYLLRAMKMLRGSGVDLTLIGRYSGDPAALAPYHDCFRYLPHMPRAALADVYRKADVFVFPTLIEGLPLVVLEAMASGLPVITTPNGPADVVRDGIDGFVVPIRDPAAIAEKLDCLRSNPALRAEMGRRARARAEQFDWARYCRGAVDFLVASGALSGPRSTDAQQVPGATTPGDGA